MIDLTYLQLDQTILNSSRMLGVSVQETSSSPLNSSHSKFKTRLIVALAFIQVNTVYHL